MTLTLLILKEAQTTIHACTLILNIATEGKMRSALAAVLVEVEVLGEGCCCLLDSPGRMGQTYAGGEESKVLLEVLSLLCWP